MAASDDLARQQVWFDEVEAEYNELVAGRDNLYQADGETVAPENQAAFNDLNGQIGGLE